MTRPAPAAPALDRVLEHLQALVELPGAPGHEAPVAAYVRAALEPHADVRTDVHGSVIANVPPDAAEAPRLLWAAHLDEVALVVRAIEPNGFLRVAALGSLGAAAAAGRVVRVGETFGVVGARAGHYQTDRDAPTEVADLFVDVGAADPGEVAAAGIVVGTPVTLAEPLRRFGRDGSWLVGHALDDRIGVALLLTLVERLAGAKVPWRWFAAFPVQEENGLRGASALTSALTPDLALAVDTIACGDTPDLARVQDSPMRLGAGPVLPVVTGPRGTGHVVPAPVLRHLEGVAAAVGVNVQRAVLTRGDNDATAMAWAAPGTLAASISIPRRYAHTGVEVARTADIAVTYALLEALVLTPWTGAAPAGAPHISPRTRRNT